MPQASTSGVRSTCHAHKKPRHLGPTTPAFCEHDMQRITSKGTRPDTNVFIPHLLCLLFSFRNHLPSLTFSLSQTLQALSHPRKWPTRQVDRALVSYIQADVQYYCVNLTHCHSTRPPFTSLVPPAVFRSRPQVKQASHSEQVSR